MAFNLTLRKVYLYLFATVGLVLVITGSVSFIDLGLKVFIFKNADTYPVYVEKRIPTDKVGEERVLTDEEIAARKAEEEDRQNQQRRADRERQAAQALAQLIVGMPLFAYHWSVIRKENQV
ncbi:MAG: hypothetical protein A3J48_01735 [Candidatus Doudnabacteria bacterium RIFCSPHIGHO2_02_FULL_46_11]|uniref:DUF5671 domain-containing protein n=1 Tax=Candidatus Doudnabacteria bacterium RIFCSPHIGHO2_02_FULL_46_11 TaxID=1817832 RepID=A0A1F5PA98_9BACT|nr:MAG: hypothetical protein A3J48_01735 [Candidatus Doudnabacteria bacterium RIFCSPHIGHO2_02_FULL_46_11]